MKPQLFTNTPSSKFYILIFFPIAMISMIAILGFKPMELSLATFPVFTNVNSGVKINEHHLRKSYIQEATITKTEQMEDVFSKVLYLSLKDENENLVALTLTDFQNSRRSICMTEGIFYGNEHEKSDLNFSKDMGTTVFSNQSNLILEKKDGSSMISRNGWITIEKCENGAISGSFEFLENKETVISKGTFKNISFQEERSL